MSFLNYFPKKIVFILTAFLVLIFLNSCGRIWAPADARKVSPSSKERVKKNLEEGAEKLFEKIKLGKIKVEISKKYDLEDVVQAHKDLEGRKIIGPAIIIP